MLNFVTWFLRGRIIGNRASCDRNSAYLRRPSHLIRPSSSNLGFNPSNLLFLGSSFWRWSAQYSSGKASCWAPLIAWISASSISHGVSSPLSYLWSLQLSIKRRTHAWILVNLFQLENRLGFKRHDCSSSSIEIIVRTSPRWFARVDDTLFVFLISVCSDFGSLSTRLTGHSDSSSPGNLDRSTTFLS